MIYQTFINRSRRLSPSSRAARAEERRPALHGELSMTDRRAHRAARSRPELGRAGPAAAAPSTAASCSSPARGTGLGKAIATEFARLGAAIVIAQPQARAPRRRPGRHRGDRRAGCSTVACDIREPDQIAAAFDAADADARPARRAGQQRGRQLPGPGRGHVAQRLAHRRRHHAQRHVLLRPRVRPPPPRRRARRGRSSTSARRYAWTGGPGFAHSAAAKAGVKNMAETLAVEWGPYGIQVNGLVPGLFPHEDMTADIRGNLDRTHDKDGCQPALRVGRAPGARVGGHLPRLAVRPLHLRPHARGRRRQLAAPLA